MAKVEAERNLLVGILALQMDLIGRDALVEAVGSWVADKSQPLEQILRKGRAIDAETQKLLAGLARKRLEARDADPARGSFAAGVVELIRGDLARFRDADVEAGLSRIRDVNRTETDPYATRIGAVGPDTLPAASPTAEVGRFRLLRLHARGGLGEVFVARDEQLHREVALKQLQDRHADRSESRLRFLLEAEVTGSLEHPGIVPVYALGRYPDGRPYYAMRFVDGMSLKEAIEAFHRADAAPKDPTERAIGFRKLLGRFLDVCNTVAFAHSRGILHRDIKPGNILLGSFGQTLVVNWGLAKTFDLPGGPGVPPVLPPGEGRVETMFGTPLGTPAYMSPEQAAGQIDRLGPASDVYSLGATLYQILTGRTPFEGDDLSRILDRVGRGQFPPPRRAARGVPGPLDKICLKAMALDPGGRYPTPGALADDIEHWLADEPVSVYRDWIPKRIWRWGRVHPWVGWSVGVLTFVVILCFLLSAFVLAIPGLLLAIVGGLIGSLAGAVRGQATQGARQGSALAFRVGIGLGAVLFAAGIIYELVAWRRSEGPGLASIRPAVGAIDGYRLASARAKAGDIPGARSWFDWADREARKAPSAPGPRGDLDRAREEAATLLGR